MTAQPGPGIACLAGIAPWKRRRVRAMFELGRDVPHARSATEALRFARQRGGAIAGWASRLPSGLAEAATDQGIALWRIEDGFIRSAGLGAALVQPCSLVLDKTGMYYDPSGPSDLETLLRERVWTSAELQRAEQLIARLRSRGTTKYNLAGKPPALPPGRRVVLVLGQVDDDLSVTLGGTDNTVATMVDAVGAEEGDACLVFKPHPDVDAGLRRGCGTPPGWVDAAGMDLNALFELADRVHVLTSLGGFEALLRGCEVVVHGAPFYAGWGLTVDRRTVSRRGRNLSLPELVAAALIAYPNYGDPSRGKPCEVEELLDALESDGPVEPPGRLAQWRGRVAQRLRPNGDRTYPAGSEQ